MTSPSATEPRPLAVRGEKAAESLTSHAPDSRLASKLSGVLGPAEKSLIRLVSPIRSGAPLAAADPVAVMDLVLKHGLGSRLFSRGEQVLFSGVTKEVTEQWAEAHRASAARMLLLAHEESSVVSALVREGIECIPLKGATLARILHGDPTARPSTDVDLAVRAADVPAAARYLLARGYDCSTAVNVLAHRPFLKHSGEHTSEAIFLRQQAGVPLMIELHWNLLVLPEHEVWSSLSNYRVAGDAPPVRTLSPTVYFLYLCAHLSGHGWMGLRWLLDAGDFLLRFAGEFDRAEFLRLTSAARLRRRVGVTLLLLDAYFGQRWVPGEILCDAGSRRLAERYLFRPLATDIDQDAGAIHFERLRVADGWPGRLRYLLWLLRPTRIEYDRDGTIRAWPAAWAHRAARLFQLATGVNRGNATTGNGQ